jgi:hypothetical protein
MRYMFLILSIAAFSALFFLTGSALSSECAACQDTCKESYAKEVFAKTGAASKDQWTKAHCFSTINGKFCLWKHFIVPGSIGEFIKKCTKMCCCPNTHQCEQRPCDPKIIRQGVKNWNKPIFAGCKVIKEGSIP